jgi:hypothetical protein
MKIPSWRTLWRGASLQRDVDELRAALKQYVVEETLAPFASIGRYLAVGAIGSLFVGFGVFLLLLGLLRYLQWQFPFLDGSESWIPYLAVFLASGAGIALLLTRIRRSVGPRRRSK